MKKAIYLLNCLFFSILLLTIPSCKYGKEYLTENEKLKIVEEVKETMHEAFEAEKSLNVNRMVEIYARTDGFVFGGDSYLTTSIDSLIESWSAWTDSMEKWLYFNIYNEYVYVLSKDAASYTCDFDWAIKTTKGDTLKCKRGSWTYVLKKINGEWKSVHSNGAHIFE